MTFRFYNLPLLVLLMLPSLGRSQELGRVFVDADKFPSDTRFRPPRRVSEGNSFQPFTDRGAWELRVRRLREQALVANGLWPLPEKCPLNAVVTSTVDCGDYTVENIYFASYPGFYVTGSLFRPKGDGPFPAVLNAHGHSKLGRLEDGKIKARDGQPDPDPWPYQARGAGFARLGCIAFLYDMVGYGESKQLRHPADGTAMRTPEGAEDFEGLEFEMHCLSTQGLQTWNSMRAVDYLLSRPDVDPKRIAVTGASGGATQTLMLMMTDDRIAAAAPVCMVSTGFQGDCICEQCALAKIGTDTVEYCAAFAPKPLIVVGATGDWTKEIVEKGGPQIRATYDLVGAADHLNVVRYEAPHNYNRRSREAVYDWLNREWNLGHPAPVREQPFDPIDPRRLHVFTEAHPRPAGALDAAGLKKFLIESSRDQLEKLRPTDAQKLAEFRRVFLPALSTIVAGELPKPSDVHAESLGFVERKKFRAQLLLLGAAGGEKIPAILFIPSAPTGAAVVLVHPDGKAALLEKSSEPGPLLAGLLDKNQTVLTIDPFLTGESAAGSRAFAADPHIGFFPCFNRTLLAQRVNDILIAVAYLHARPGASNVNLVGLKTAGPWCLLARGLCGNAVSRTAADVTYASFSKVKDVADPDYLPGVLRYGDLAALAALTAPGEMLLSNAHDFDSRWIRDAYHSCGIGEDSDKLQIRNEPATAEQLVAWLTK